MVTTPPRPRLRVKGVRIAMMCRRTVSKIDDFSSKFIVKKSTRRLCNGSETTRKTRENRSFFVEIECQKINTLVLQLRAASTSYAKLQNLVQYYTGGRTLRTYNTRTHLCTGCSFFAYTILSTLPACATPVGALSFQRRLRWRLPKIPGGRVDVAVHRLAERLDRRAAVPSALEKVVRFDSTVQVS